MDGIKNSQRVENSTERSLEGATLKGKLRKVIKKKKAKC